MDNSAEGVGECCREALGQLLELQRQQMVTLRGDGQERLGALGKAFQVLVSHIDESKAAQVPDLQNSIGSAVATLQFADNQAQRFEHLIRAFEQMAMLLSSTAFDDAGAWQALRRGMRASYTMERECEVFDRVFGEDAESVGELPPDATSTTDSVELF